MLQLDLSVFDVPEPLLIGMSGGQTSAYQLWLFLERLGGKIVGRRTVAFANTGDEDERTLKFVERIAVEWGVDIQWVEYRFEPLPADLLADPEFRDLRRRQFADRANSDLRHHLALCFHAHGFPDLSESIRQGRECLNGRSTYAVVNYATASRNKEPYTAMLRAREDYRQDVKGLVGVLPCPSQRLCTGQLKMNTMRRLMEDTFGTAGPRGYNVALALRADEEERLYSAREREIECGVPYFPMADANITGDDVAAFWRTQPFRLGMKSYEGNCRLCFMKKAGAIDRLIRQCPECADWWIDWERRAGDRFRRDRDSYAALKWQAQNQPLLFAEPEETETVIACEGGYCSD
jgi:hypothetical protein